MTYINLSFNVKGHGEFKSISLYKHDMVKDTFIWTFHQAQSRYYKSQNKYKS